MDVLGRRRKEQWSSSFDELKLINRWIRIATHSYLASHCYLSPFGGAILTTLCPLATAPLPLTSLIKAYGKLAALRITAAVTGMLITTITAFVRRMLISRNDATVRGLLISRITAAVRGMLISRITAAAGVLNPLTRTIATAVTVIYCTVYGI